ncbi:GvpL/GvpF family gas vesicle protein [uncultured Thiohalocapsa sp.]|uniref:GvpL/GvpF family gas vesicle protein n=1 Tax=uncultured Thiohalocapsa sp. TaxID=768990 RepID=UPI0025F83E47|nr:GvpL/GvpF family gas vesicle protein [uncultured Thiohalocapsa sp.]
MPRTTNSSRGKLIYALTDFGEGSDEQIYKVQGIGGNTVYSISTGDVSAVVSDIHSPKVRPERRNLMAHRAVLAHLLEVGSVLPMRFGVVAANAEAVRDLLRVNNEAITEQLYRVRHRIEMGLRVSWDVANIYEYFVGMHPLLQEARDRLLALGDNAPRDEKIEVGRLFDRLVNEAREQYTEQVMEVMRNHCEEVMSNPTKKEKEVMNLACLIERDAQAEFERGVFEASKLFNNDYLFDYNGPWAPHNFVELDLKTPATAAAEEEAG